MMCQVGHEIVLSQSLSGSTEAQLVLLCDSVCLCLKFVDTKLVKF